MAIRYLQSLIWYQITNLLQQSSGNISSAHAHVGVLHVESLMNGEIGGLNQYLKMTKKAPGNLILFCQCRYTWGHMNVIVWKVVAKGTKSFSDTAKHLYCLFTCSKCSWEFDLSDVYKVVQYYHRYTYKHFVRDFMKIAVGC